MQCNLVTQFLMNFSLNFFSRFFRLYQEGGGEDGGGGGEEVTINLRVKDQGGEEMVFKVKKLTKMQKIFDAYSTRKGVSPNALRFMLDGQRIDGDNTPKMLELEDNDQIDVLLQQLGGRNT